MLLEIEFMGLESITQIKIDNLLDMPKRVTNSNAREKEKYTHIQRNYKVIGIDDNSITFSLFIRNNKLLDNDFSCGLIWNAPSGDTLTLIRYNGSSHDHKNHLENESFKACFHIHKAQEKYLKAGKKAEGYAEKTDKYNTVEGALYCLLKDCNISGLTSKQDMPGLFDEH